MQEFENMKNIAQSDFSDNTLFNDKLSLPFKPT